MCVDFSVDICDEDSSSLELCPFHRAGWEFRDLADLDQMSRSLGRLQQRLAILVVPFEQVGRRPIFRLFFKFWKLVHFRRELDSSSHPFLFDQVLDSCTDGSAWDSLDCWMEESDN